MDFVTPVLDLASRLWDCTSNRAVYIRELPHNLHSLRNAMEQLNSVCLDVKEKLEREEKHHKKRTHAVDSWIKDVDALEKQVNELLAKGNEEIQKKCPGTCCPKNCRATYKIGKAVVSKMEDVISKKTEGQNFSVVAEPLSSPAVIERPLDATVGVDPFFNHLCMQLQDEQVTRLGLYGMGGVGKTTLLNRINNEYFHKTRGVDLDAVIQVTVSRPADVGKIQQDICKRLEINDGNKSEGMSEDERRDEIFNVLKTKKVVLLLDDVWEPLDLVAVGIPTSSHDSTGNVKVVLTTRFLSVCRHMHAKAIEVKRLEWEDAFALFQKHVGEDTINSHPHIPKLVEIAAKECGGLPLALKVIGRAMAGANTPQEWHRKIDLLKNYPNKFPGMKKDLFSRLVLSFDSLKDEATKSCFLYCSLFPEDYEIDSNRLIQLWIGEGFLDEDSGRKQASLGEEIIESLSHACLLEVYGVPNPDYFDCGQVVKMHDMIRDMALWLSNQDGDKKQNKYVALENGGKGGLVDARQIEKWKGAQRISLFNTGFEEHLELPFFSNLQTLLCCDNFHPLTPLSFPSGFFTCMSNITVLDFTRLLFRDLPAGIDKLEHLQYLNLSHTTIKEIPRELGNLKKLRCLILNYMQWLHKFPSGIISCLSSLRIFSIINEMRELKDCKALMEELEGLKYMEEVSISLWRVLSIQTLLLNSRMLTKCLRFLTVHDCEDVNTLHLSSPDLEKLMIYNCLMLEDVVVNLGKELGVHSTFPRNEELIYLSHVSIENCENLKKLTCLAYAPNLKVLWIVCCGSLGEVVVEEEESCGVSSEIKSEGDDVFSSLIHLYLMDLEKLRSIHKRNLLFPALEKLVVEECPLLRKLPFDSSITQRKRLAEIGGDQEWWDELEWEDETVMRHLTPSFQPFEPSEPLINSTRLDLAQRLPWDWN